MTITIARTDPIAGDAAAMQKLVDGLGNAAATVRHPEFDATYDAWEASFMGDGPFTEAPVLTAWQRLVDEAIAEVAPEVATLLDAAIAKRLPWTFEDQSAA